ncbi:ARM repeat-containing protein [Schizopora paradoxa]|uniref:ARM repeat-containing protein n=1 Tax=Schizopora paradoxa TaxID=27342 RepID=A0A0H2S1F7_9AGAM|nr:ARM repeat-containing protein [Schizopora paradoxa]
MSPTTSIRAFTPSSRRSFAKDSESNKGGSQTDTSHPSSSINDRTLRGLLNKIANESFTLISTQIATIINECGCDDQTLSVVVRLIYEHGVNDIVFAGLYARLCQTLMEQIHWHPEFADGSGRSFRELLLDHCQTQFAILWSTCEDTASISVDARQASKAHPRLFSDEYYAVQKFKRHRRGLAQFVGELHIRQMVTGELVHNCVGRFLEGTLPGEQEIESLCILLSVAGQSIEAKDRLRVDAYFERIENIAVEESVSFRMSSLLKNVIELRQRNWIARGLGIAPALPQERHAVGRQTVLRER